MNFTASLIAIAATLTLACAAATEPSQVDSGSSDASQVDSGSVDATQVDSNVTQVDSNVTQVDSNVTQVDSTQVDGGCLRGEGAPVMKSVEVKGVARTYWVVGGGAPGGGAVPVVFAWHGLGGSGALARAYFGLEQAAGGGALFVYPNALALPSFGGRTGWDLGPEGDVRFFDTMLESVTATYCVDRARVYSTGHSFGGYMSNTLGCTRPRVLRAIAPVAGGLPPGACPGAAAGPVAVWSAHGNNDNVVPFAAGEAALATWLRASGCTEVARPAEPSPCVAYQGCAAGAPVHWCVHQQMHNWPAFAGRAIWAFFAAAR